MKIAILETEHFQYALTLSEIFNGSEKTFFVYQNIKDEMLEYSPELCDGKLHVIETIGEGEHEIIEICNKENIDLVLLNPVFENYSSVLSIAQQVKGTTVITTHNLNTWFNGMFWSPNSYKDRVVMRKILEACDYIAVEDFIYAYLQNENIKLYNKFKFLYIPFTVFHENTSKEISKEVDKLKVVITGHIEKERRRYEEVLEVIKHFAETKAAITFSFTGQATEEYGYWVQSQLDKANQICPGIASYTADNTNIVPALFRKEMESSDLVLSASAVKFKGTGTTEYIGKTKATGVIYDMVTFELPGLLPSHLITPKNLEGSVFNYENAQELTRILVELMEKPGLLEEWKSRATENSRHYSAQEIRKGLPFFTSDNKEH